MPILIMGLRKTTLLMVLAPNTPFHQETVFVLTIHVMKASPQTVLRYLTPVNSKTRQVSAFRQVKNKNPERDMVRFGFCRFG